jgi:uncharacterized membrane protein
MLATTNSGIYKLLLVVHILSVVVGIGAVMLNGLYAQQVRKRQGPAGRAVFEANFYVTGIAEYVIYTIPIWGILLIATSDSAWKFSQTWIWLALLLYVVALGIAHAVMIPNSKRILSLMGEIEQGPPPAGGPPPQVAQITQLGQRLAFGGATLNVLVVILIGLMVWKPGT